MPSIFKKILIVFTIIIGLAIIIVPFLPKPKLSFSERQEIWRVIDEINRDLPKKVGTIGQLDKVSFGNDTLCYYFSNYGDSSIDEFYEENYEEVQEIMKYGCLTLKGQKNGGTKLASLLDSKGIILKTIFTTPSSKEFDFIFTGKELLDFINKIRISPTEALHTILDTHISLANLSLPMGLDDFGQIQSISNNTIKNSLGSGDRLIEIRHSGNDVIFTIETNEKEFKIKDIKPYTNNETFLTNFTESMVEDLDVKEFVDMLVVSHSNFTYHYYNPNSSESVNITIPYRILKKYSTIKSLNLL